MPVCSTRCETLAKNGQNMHHKLSCSIPRPSPDMAHEPNAKDTD